MRYNLDRVLGLGTQGTGRAPEAAAQAGLGKVTATGPRVLDEEGLCV